MRTAFSQFNKVSGALLNEHKTTSVDIGPTSGNSLSASWLKTEPAIKILGLIFTNCIREMIKLNWEKLTLSFSRHIWLHSLRTLTLHQKVVLLNTFISSKLWYVASNIMPYSVHIAKITATIGTFLWRGYCARVPIQQLARNIEHGGLKLHIPAFKCKALLINRHLREIDSMPFYKTFIQNRTQTSVPTTLPCLSQVLESYPNIPDQLRQTINAAGMMDFFISQTELPRVEREQPHANWRRIWTNLSSHQLSPSHRCSLYVWANGKTLHQQLLHTMRRADGDQCLYCGSTETIEHKFFSCSRVRQSFGLLQQLIVAIGGRRLSSDDLLRPALEGINRNTRTAILRLLASYIDFFVNCSDVVVNINELEFSLTSEF